jgi:hypothetical protein
LLFLTLSSDFLYFFALSFSMFFFS